MAQKIQMFMEWPYTNGRYCRVQPPSSEIVGERVVKQQAGCCERGPTEGAEHRGATAAHVNIALLKITWLCNGEPAGPCLERTSAVYLRQCLD